MTDMRPCTMEAFTIALLQHVPSDSLKLICLRSWVRGDYVGAFSPLPDHARRRLTGKGGA